MTEWICLDCRCVFEAGDNHEFCGSCESERLTRFNPTEHGRLLIGSSNSWLRLSNEWSDCYLYEEVRDQAFADGCHGAASILRRFVFRLLEDREDLIKGMRDVINPVGMLEREKPNGSVLDGSIMVQLIRDPNTAVHIAKATLRKCGENV